MKTRLDIARIGVVLIASLAFVCPEAGNAAGGVKEGIRLSNYWEISDPAVAGQKLLDDAERYGYDIDALPGNGQYDGPIRLPSGRLSPNEPDSATVATLKSELTGLSKPVCIVQLRRWISLRELATLMKAGAKVIGKMPPVSYVALLPTEAVDDVVALEFVRWVGRYRAEHKYDPDWNFLADEEVLVESLVGRRPEFRDDLARIGARSIQWRQSYYSLRLDPALILRVCDLWWVEQVSQAEPSVPDVRNDDGFLRARQRRRFG
jgi:hypothetical protein